MYTYTYIQTYTHAHSRRPKSALRRSKHRAPPCLCRRFRPPFRSCSMYCRLYVSCRENAPPLIPAEIPAGIHTCAYLCTMTGMPIRLLIAGSVTLARMCLLIAGSVTLKRMCLRSDGSWRPESRRSHQHDQPDNCARRVGRNMPLCACVCVCVFFFACVRVKDI
jgi:hypothetical protein